MKQRTPLSVIMCFLISACTVLLGATDQSPKQVPWKDIKHIFTKLKIEYKVAKAEDDTEMMLCTWKPSGWTLALDVSASDDSRLLWLVVKLNKVDPETKIPSDPLLELMQQNDDIGPAYFSFDKGARQFLINDPVVNFGMTLEQLREELDRLFEIIKKTQKFWDSAMWPKTSN